MHGIAQMIGVPETDGDIFRDWIYRNFQLAPRDNRIREQVTAEMMAYFATCSHVAPPIPKKIWPR